MNEYSLNLETGYMFDRLGFDIYIYIFKLNNLGENFVWVMLLSLIFAFLIGCTLDLKLESIHSVQGHA